MATVTLSESNNGQHIEVASGDTIQISLREIPTTGFRWEFSEADRGQIEVLAEDFDLNADSATGGGGRKIIRLKVVQKGDGRLKLVNKQVGSGNVDGQFEISYS